MAGGFDELIEHLLNEIAYAGENGVTIPEFKSQVEKFYHSDHEASSKNQSTNHVLNPIVDDRLLEKIWSWVRKHDEIWVGQRREGNHLSLAQLQAQDDEAAAQNETHGGNGPVSITVAVENEFVIYDESEDEADNVADQNTNKCTGWRIFTSQDRIWQAVAGHGVDFARVPRMEFEALCIIARAGPGGILQPDIVRATGQDKRSLPKRTDVLANAGYIQKKVVYAKKVKTSHCVHMRYFKAQDEDILAERDVQQVGIFRENHLVLDDFLAFLLQTIAVGDAMPISDFNHKIERAGSTKKALSAWQRKSIRRCLERLDIIGVTQRCRLRFPRAVGGKPKNVAVIRLLRAPGTADLHKFHTVPLAERVRFRQLLVKLDNEARQRHAEQQTRAAERQAARKAKKQGQASVPAEPEVHDTPTNETQDNDIADGPTTSAPLGRPSILDPEDDGSDGDDLYEEYEQAISDIEDLDDDGGDAVEQPERRRPCWDPDELQPNLLYNLLEDAGQTGLASQELKEQVFGYFYVRPLDNILSRLTNDWRTAQPQYIRHLGLIRDVASHTKQQQFLYRTHSQFQRLVDAGEAEWSSVLDKKVPPNSCKFDQWGFPVLNNSELVRTSGIVTLTEAIERSNHKPSSMEELIYRTDDGEWRLELDEYGRGTRSARSGRKPGPKSKHPAETPIKQPKSALEKAKVGLEKSSVIADFADTPIEEAERSMASVRASVKLTKRASGTTKKGSSQPKDRRADKDSPQGAAGGKSRRNALPQIISAPQATDLHLLPLPQSYDPGYYKIWQAKRKHQEATDKREAQILRYAEWLATQEVIAKTSGSHRQEGPIPLIVGYYEQHAPATPTPSGPRKRGRPRKHESLDLQLRSKRLKLFNGASSQHDAEPESTDTELPISSPLLPDAPLLIQADRVHELAEVLRDSSREGVHVNPPGATAECIRLHTRRNQESCVVVFRYPWLRNENWRRRTMPWNWESATDKRSEFVVPTALMSSKSIQAYDTPSQQAVMNAEVGLSKDAIEQQHIRALPATPQTNGLTPDMMAVDCVVTSNRHSSDSNSDQILSRNFAASTQSQKQALGKGVVPPMTAAALPRGPEARSETDLREREPAIVALLTAPVLNSIASSHVLDEVIDIRAPLASDVLSSPLPTSDLPQISDPELSKPKNTEALPVTSISPYSTRVKPRPSAKQAALLETPRYYSKPCSKPGVTSKVSPHVSRVLKRGRKKLNADPSLVLKFTSPKVQAMLNAMEPSLAGDPEDDPMEIDGSNTTQSSSAEETLPASITVSDQPIVPATAIIENTDPSLSETQHISLRKEAQTKVAHDRRRPSVARETPKLVDTANSAGAMASPPKRTPKPNKRPRLDSPTSATQTRCGSNGAQSRTASVSGSESGRYNKRKQSNQALDRFRSLQHKFSSKTKMVTLRYNSSASSAGESSAEDSSSRPISTRKQKAPDTVPQTLWRHTSGSGDLDEDDDLDPAGSDEEMMQEVEQTVQDMTANETGLKPQISHPKVTVEPSPPRRVSDAHLDQYPTEPSSATLNTEPPRVRVVLDVAAEAPKLIGETHANPEDAYALRKRVTDGIDAQNKYRRKKTGVGMGGGSVKTRRLNVIVEIVRQAGGAFGGDNEIIRPFQNISRREKMSTGVPDRDTIIRTMRAAVYAKAVKRVRWSFRDKCGVEQKRHLLLLPELDKDSPAVGKMMEAIKKDWPNLHIPLHLLGDQLRGRIDTKQAKQVSRTVVLLDAETLNSESVWVQEHRKRVAEMAAKQQREEEERIRKQQAEKERLAKLAASKPRNARRPFKSIRDGLERPPAAAPVAKMQVSKEDQDTSARILRNLLPLPTDDAPPPSQQYPRRQRRKSGAEFAEPDFIYSGDETLFQSLYGSPMQRWENVPGPQFDLTRPSAITGVFRGYDPTQAQRPETIDAHASGRSFYNAEYPRRHESFIAAAESEDDSDYTPRASATLQNSLDMSRRPNYDFSIRRPSFRTEHSFAKMARAPSKRSQTKAWKWYNSTAETYDSYWQWQHHGILLWPQQTFYSSIGVFSTDFSCTVNAYAELWQHHQGQARFKHSTPADVREMIRAEGGSAPYLRYSRASHFQGREKPEIVGIEEYLDNYPISAMPYSGGSFINYQIDHAYLPAIETSHNYRPGQNFTVYTVPGARPHRIMQDFTGPMSSPSSVRFFNTSWGHIPTSTIQVMPSDGRAIIYQALPPPPPPVVAINARSAASSRVTIKDASTNAVIQARKTRGPRKATVDETFESLVQRRKKLKPRLQMAGRSDFTIDSDMAHRLFYACIVVKILDGGANQAVNWDIVKKLCASHGAWNMLAFKKRWEIMLEFHSGIIYRAESQFQDAFLAAVENDEWPDLDLENIHDSDWVDLVDWSMENVSAPAVEAEFELPQTRQDLEQAYKTTLRARETDVIGDDMFNPIATMQSRAEILTQIDFSHALRTAVSKDKLAEVKDDQLYKSVTRACIATPEEVYDRERATSLLKRLNNSKLIEASAQLRRDKIVAHNNKGRLQEHRSYHLGEAYHDIHKKTGVFGRNITLETFHLALEFKKSLDEIFASETPEFVPGELIQDHEVVVLLELLYHQRIQLTPRLPPFNDQIGDPWPRISKWGFGHEGLFNKKKTDREVYIWACAYTPTSSYIPGIPLSPNLTATPIPRIPRGDDPDHTRIPLWIDIHGSPIPEFWLKTLQAVVQGAAVRAGMTVSELERLFKGFLWDFEVEMVVKWLVQTGVASWRASNKAKVVTSGSEKSGGLFKDSHELVESGVGLVANEWWWTLFDQKVRWHSREDSRPGC